jgi:hypothetical protein
MSSRPTGSRSRATTAALRDVRPTPPQYTCLCSMGSPSRATPSTPRDIHPLSLPDKGILDATEELSVAGVAPRIDIIALRLHLHQAIQTEAPSPPTRRASHGSPQ